jgi:L-ribulose-5-phosphate 4-epimerase
VALAHAELRESVLAANRDIVRAGLVTLSFGNASGVDRRAGVVAIKPSGVPYERLRAADIVLVELESGRVADGSLRPSSDTPTHLALYRSFNSVGGVVHTHSPFATAWAQARRELPCLGTTHADHFLGPVPVSRMLTSEEMTDYELATGLVIVETLMEAGRDPASTQAVLVASHGPFVWGDDVPHAVENAIALETVAALAFRTLLLDAGAGAIPAILLEKHFRRKHGPSAYYGQPR